VRKRWRIIFGIILIVWSIIYTFGSIKDYLDIQEKVDSGIALKTSGRVSDFTPTSQPGYKVMTCLATYEYTVDGTKYTESGISCSTIGKFSVYYDSRNPDVVIYVNGLELGSDFIYLFFPIGIMMVYIGFKKYNYL